MHIVSDHLSLHRKGKPVPAAVAMVRGTLETLVGLLERLHPKEMACYDSWKHARRKESYLLGRLSAKAALTELTGFGDATEMFIDTGVFDFPVVRCVAIPNQQVSISHCGGISISIAFAEAHPMGIDIEEVDNRHREVLYNQLTTKEKLLIKDIQLDDIRGYTLLWSIKESLSKIIRTGMMIDFSLLEVNTLLARGTWGYVSTFSQFGQYQTASCYLGDHVVSITLPKRSVIDFRQAESFFWNLDEDWKGCRSI